jgi:hypothetical protein
LVFSDEACRRNHAFRYALDLHRKGIVARIVLEGIATGSLRELDDPASDFAPLFREAAGLGLVAGACRAACGGCRSDDPNRSVIGIAEAHGVPLLDGAEGHASLEPFVREGYQVLVF